MNNVIVRTITGTLFILAIMASILVNEWVSVGLFSVFALLSVHEFLRLIHQNTTYQPSYGFNLVLTSLLLIGASCIFSGCLPVAYGYLLFPIILITFFVSLFGKSTTPIQNVALTFFPLIYIVIPFIMITHLCFELENKWEVIGLFVVIWTNDTLAYCCGRLFGRRKLFERISPKKTWEGTIGGIIFALIAGYLWSVFLSDLPQSFWLIVSPLLALGAIFGDLFESQFKRQLGVKDSGNILPGHGGMLDRFDAAFLAIPIFYSIWMIYNLSPTLN